MVCYAACSHCSNKATRPLFSAYRGKRLGLGGPHGLVECLRGEIPIASSKTPSTAVSCSRTKKYCSSVGLRALQEAVMTLYVMLLLIESSSDARRISLIATGASSKTILTYSLMDRHSSVDGCCSASEALDSTSARTK